MIETLQAWVAAHIPDEIGFGVRRGLPGARRAASGRTGRFGESAGIARAILVSDDEGSDPVQAAKPLDDVLLARISDAHAFYGIHKVTVAPADGRADRRVRRHPFEAGGSRIRARRRGHPRRRE